jgi:penicillin amidase
MSNTRNARRVGAPRHLLSAALAAALASGAFAASAQTITAPGLTAPGSIVYDAEGMPIIRAASENDAAFLIGWAHARDRFWQMDVTRRQVSGRLAELLGPAALASDVQLRTLGLRRAAEATWNELSAETRGWLKAYSDGVNFWLANNPLPPEYAAIEITRAEPWSPLDSIVVGKGLAFNLSFDLDTGRTQQLGAYQAAGAAAGFNGTALFFEDVSRSQPDDGRLSIPGFRPADGATGDDGAKLTAAVPQVDPELLGMLERFNASIRDNPLLGPKLEGRKAGSNWWLVAGSRSASGRPLIANDPHLGLGLPSTFQEIQINVGTTINVVGVSVPGTPGVVQGCTQRFCWGSTVNPTDVTDVFQEQFVLNSFGLPVATIFRGNAEPVRTIFQSFIVNRLDGVPDNAARDNSIGYTNGAVTVIVPRRNDGPVLSITGNTGLSVQYTGWGATFELECFRRINRAANLAEFRDALTFFDIGAQNFGYADVDGNIAYFTSAEIPLRDDLQNLNAADATPPWFIRDGTGQRRHEWLLATAQNRQRNQATRFELLPLEEMPSLLNPSQGYIANANNDPIGVTLTNNPLSLRRSRGGVLYLAPGYDSLRQGRIDRELQRLVARGNVTLGDMAALQANNQFLDAELMLRYLLAAADNAQAANAWPELRALMQDTRVAEAITRLRAWNFSSPTGIREGFDPGDDPTNLPNPSADEIANSVAATIWSMWRGQALRNTMDAALVRVGLGGNLSSPSLTWRGFKFQLDNWATRRGVGASGLNFFVAPGAPNPEAARDFLLLASLRDALNLAASADFAPAFNRSLNLNDYRWGRLHRITFNHPLGQPFSVPSQLGLGGFTNLSPQLPGVARPGGFEVVDDSDHSVRASTVNGFMFGGGPNRRKLADMTATPTVVNSMPGGASGVLSSPTYVNQLGRWLTNRYRPHFVDPAQATANPSATVNFQPRP